MSSSQSTLLFVEADEEKRNLLLSKLEQTGVFSIEFGANGTEALDIAKEKEFDFAVIDWFVPDLPGAPFIQKIRNESKCRNTHILILSNSVSDEDIVMLHEYDIFHWLPKSSDVNKIEQKLAELVKERELEKPNLTKLRQLESAIISENEEDASQLAQSPEIIKQLRTNPKFFYLFGEFLILKKQTKAAAEFLQDAIKTIPGKSDNLKALATLGKALCLLHEFDAANSVFEKLISKSPKNLKHRISLADSQLASGDVQNAKENYQNALKADDTHKDALVGMGKSAVSEGNVEEAKGYFAKIKGPFESYSLASFFNNRAVALAKSGKLDEAISFYENSLNFLSKYKGHVLFNLGLAYDKKGNPQKAQTLYEEAVASGASALIGKKDKLKNLKSKENEEFVEDEKQKSETTYS